MPESSLLPAVRTEVETGSVTKSVLFFLNPATQIETWHIFLIILCILYVNTVLFSPSLQSLVLDLQAAAVTQPPGPGGARWVTRAWMLLVGSKGL